MAKSVTATHDIRPRGVHAEVDDPRRAREGTQLADFP